MSLSSVLLPVVGSARARRLVYTESRACSESMIPLCISYQ